MDVTDAILLTHLRNFIAFCVSDTLWYNFDSQKIITDHPLQNQSSFGQPPIRLVSNIPNILPVYGNIDKAIQFWIPKLEEFLEHRLKESFVLFGNDAGEVKSPGTIRKRNPLNQANPKSIFNTLDEDQILDIIDGMPGVGLIAACAASPRFQDICKRHQSKLFSKRLQKEYPFYEAVTEGSEMEAYETLVKGTRIVTDPQVFDFEGFASIKDLFVTSYGTLYKMIVGGFIQTGGFFSMFAYDATDQFHDRLETLLQRKYLSQESVIPQNVDLPFPMINASVSGTHVLVLLDDGNVYRWGVGGGFPSIPTMIMSDLGRPYNLDYQLIGVCAGNTFSIYYSSTEIIFTGQLGKVNEVDKFIGFNKSTGKNIVEVISFNEIPDKIFIRSETGETYSMDDNFGIILDEDPSQTLTAALDVFVDAAGTVTREGRVIGTNVKKVYSAGEVVFMLK